MSTFPVVVRTSLPPDRAFTVVTDWPAHSVPLTTVEVVGDGDGRGLGGRFVGRTRFGPVLVDDPMEVVEWAPPAGVGAGAGETGRAGHGRCRVVKTGRVVRGGATLDVHPVPGGTLVRWVETVSAGPRPLAPLLDAGARVVGPWVFGRLLRTLLEEAERDHH
ncbi:SRPBCC family protein [Thalassiella azotivora]